MKKKFKGKVFVSLIIISLWILPTIIYAEKQNIEVVVENASIRLKPDMTSEIIESPTVGTVYEVERKIGEWYEVKFYSQGGVLVAGYIHEMFVAVGAELTPSPQVTAPRGEITFSAGYNFGYSLNETITYSDSWYYALLDSVVETGELTQILGKPIGFGGSFSYFFAGGLGIQLRLDLNSKASFTEESESIYDLNWTWYYGATYEIDQVKWDVEGDLSLMVISGNLVYRVPTGEMFVPSFSGGISYFTGKITGETTGGYADSWIYGGSQYIDNWDIDAELDGKISGIGFNIGGGVDILFSPKVGFNIDARYFLSKKFDDLRWEIVPGDYDSDYFGATITISQENAELLSQGIDPIELNPSFFKISVGLKIMF